MDGGFGNDEPHGGKGFNFYLDADQPDTLDAISFLFGQLVQTSQQTQFTVISPAASSVPSRSWDLAADSQVQDVMNAVQVPRPVASESATHSRTSWLFHKA